MIETERLVYDGIDFTSIVERLISERQQRMAVDSVKTRNGKARREDLIRALREPKLSLGHARHIRRMRERYRWSQRDLARQFGVSREMIRQILRNKVYKEPAPAPMERAS